jgi:hypothetical protein
MYLDPKRNLLILAGNNVFKAMYLGRTINYFQDDMLDKIIFQDGFAISAN